VPLTDKGKKILGAMKNTYGKEKGESVFYAMENKEQTKMMNNTKKPASAMGKAKKKAGMAMGGVSAAAKAGGKAYGTGMAKGGMAKKKGK
jgi:hypothetical protein